MVRAIALCLGLALLAGGTAGVMAALPTIPLAIMGAVIMLGLMLERYIYKPIRTDLPGMGWARTGERFTDPNSGKFVSVYFNAETGERRYVAD